MLIVLSPSKTMDIKTSSFLTSSKELYEDTTNKLVSDISALSKQGLKKLMKLSDKQTTDVYHMYQTFPQADKGHAITSYTGFVFKKLDIDQYKQAEFDYLETHVRILDALYGLLKPSTLIRPYRLDFTMKIDKQSLYDVWTITDHLKDTCIINLASKEYAKMLGDLEVIDVSFLEHKDGRYKNIATYSKQARGMLLNYMTKEKIKNKEGIKGFHEAGYRFNEDLSSKLELVFTR